MTRAALTLFVATWASATVVGYALTAVLPAVEATAAAYVLGILVAVCAGAEIWRAIRRATRG